MTLLCRSNRQLGDGLCLSDAIADLLEVGDEAACGDSGPLRLLMMEPDVNSKTATELYQS